MLSSNRRISQEVFQKLGRGVMTHSPLFSLITYKKPEATVSQFACIASKKVALTAVRRNLLRRRVYEAIQSVLSRIEPGYYFVFTAKKGAENASFADTQATIQDLLAAYLTN